MRKLILSLILIMMTAIPAHAEWTEPVRITHGLGPIGTRAVIVEDTIHVIAQGGPLTDFYYLRS
ncbi:MAG: hypothetical protein GF307_05630, partial [candidate division Zixibacteria bacterium]|nr:hypothetical protein [candidate division Zixibacteria bacterium]